MIEFELNGKKLSVPEGTTIIEAADQVGEYIPRFCYHKKLSVAANCRMCLVEVEKSAKPLPACATPITPNMKINTKSDMALKAQRDVMAFLLINHPLDCPICDQGGECELQDLSLGFGHSQSEYREPKRAVCSQDIGPLIETEMTRCIQCTRCVRFGEEIAGLREMGVVNRGEKEEIGTYVQHFLKSEMSGNIIDLCPVGALTNKPARYAARGWELREHPSISPNDCVGTNMFLHTRDNKVIRAVPRENEAINEPWMSDRDRFCVEGLYHPDRIYKPLMKKNNAWMEVEWPYALEAIKHLTQHLIAENGASCIAGIAGYTATLEEYYLFQKFIRGLGSNHVDHRIREHDFSDQARLPLFPQANITMSDIDALDVLLLVGSNVRFEQPILSTRIYKATQDKLHVITVNPENYPFLFSADTDFDQADIVSALTQHQSALIEKLSAGKSAILLGAHAQHHPCASEIRAWAHRIAEASQSTVGVLSDGPNSAGAWLAGCVPHRGAGGELLETSGRDAKTLLTHKPAQGYFILNAELENDAGYSVEAALAAAKMVVCLSTYTTEKMLEYANFILPISPFAENEGTYINLNGVSQAFHAATLPHGHSRPAWRVLCALARTLELTGFSYRDAFEIGDEVQLCSSDSVNANLSVLPPEAKNKTTSSTESMRTWSINQDNALVRHAMVLQSEPQP